MNFSRILVEKVRAVILMNTTCWLLLLEKKRKMVNKYLEKNDLFCYVFLEHDNSNEVWDEVVYYMTI